LVITELRYTTAAVPLEAVDPELLERVRLELAESINRQLEAMTLSAFLRPPAPRPWRARRPFAHELAPDWRGLIRVTGIA
jgi:hypothetical protein